MGKYTEVGEKPADKPTGYCQFPTTFGLKSPAIESAVFAIGFMAIVPSHLLRSVGGMYDNESVATTAMCLTFYFWMRSLRSGEKYSYLIGILAGIAYFYMVATWGGYIFVLNLIGAHAALLVLLGRFSDKVYLAYTLFYIVGTSLAIQVPVVGWTPLKSLEQLGPCAVFLGYQVLQYCEMLRNKNKWSRAEAWKFRVKFGAVALIGLVIVIMAVTPKGYFGPMSSRVRGLFVPHTKTGNPLVDSVGEHFVTPLVAYWEFLHLLCILTPVGLIFTMFRFGDSASFLFVYAFVAYFFSRKMTRLLVLTAPVASAFAGVVCGHLFAASLSALVDKYEIDGVVTMNQTRSNGKSKSDKKKRVPAIQKDFKTKGWITARRIAAIVVLGGLYYMEKIFYTECWRVSAPRGGISAPLILSKNKARHPDGYDLDVVVDDFREGCWWLRDETPIDSRVLAWWDFGYQITSLANRTTTADGNTWNHEHIALIGKALTSNEEEGYQIARHLADYIYIRIDGSAGNDLDKSPHFARIANSVYRDHCPGDPTCHQFGVDVSSVGYFDTFATTSLFALHELDFSQSRRHHTRCWKTVSYTNSITME
jgi:dolichyl-diphosphooligosaccharide--protein glycosyltransferase